MIGDGGFGDVNIQDQTTPPIDSYFLQSLSNFTLAADTVKSTDIVFQYTFEATAGHAIPFPAIPNSEILLLDVLSNTSFYAEVLNVVGDTITVDRPIDHVFPSGGATPALCRIVNSNMVTNGAITPQIFSLRAGSIPVDAVRFIISMTSDASMDTAKFGSLNKLARGFLFRIYNGFQRTIFNFKTNGEIKNFCYDVDYDPKAPAGFYGLTARISFGGQSKHGVVLRIRDLDVLQWINQDDLTGSSLLTLKVAIEGHETDVEF